LSTDVSEVRAASIIIPDDGGSIPEDNSEIKQFYKYCKMENTLIA
jgi:hypothetical protein